MPKARVVAVGVRDNRTLDRTPRIDVEISGRAVQALRAGNDQSRVCHQAVNMHDLADGEFTVNKAEDEQARRLAILFAISPRDA
jgi:hypothetical protein